MEDAGPARFVPLGPPGEEERTAILERMVHRTAKALLRYNEAESEADALAALQAAEVDRRLRFYDPFKHPRRSAFLDGSSLHAGVRIHERDREDLERPCRYAVGPPFSLHRLSRAEDGRLVYRMKRPREARFGSCSPLTTSAQAPPEHFDPPGPTTTSPTRPTAT